MSFYGTLYPYQEAARDLILNEMTALICYEMGLGKTPTTVAAIEQLADEEQVDAGLVIGLSGLKFQWQKSIEKFTCDSCFGKLETGEDGHKHTPTATSIVIDGTKAQREKQYAEAMTGDYRYIILNYEACVGDWARVKKLPRDFVVCDEVTAIKSFKSQRSRRVKRLQAPYKVGLTGTPMEGGRLEELFSIMSWVNEDVLGRFDIFDRTFLVRNQWGAVQRARNVPLFRKTMERSWIVKTQDDPDVAPYLPKVREQNIYPTLDPVSAKLYRTIAGELITDLGDALSQGMSGFDLAALYTGGNDAIDQMRGKIMSKMTALFMLCDHPKLLEVSANRYAESLKTGKEGGSEYAYALQQGGLLEPVLKIKTPPKMTAVKALIDEAMEADLKMVVFCHDVPALPLIRDMLPAGSAVIYDGTMNATQKEAAKTAFSIDPKVKVFLSSDSGGFGLDLPVAARLLSVDLPYTNGALRQRQSRIIRASSTHKSVLLYNTLVQGSVDIWLHQKVAGKVAMAEAFILGKGLDKKGGLDLDPNSLMQFLLNESP